MAYLVDSDRLIVTDGGGTDAVELVDCKNTKLLTLLNSVPAWNHGVYNPVDKIPFTLKMVAAQMRRPMLLSIIDTNSFKQVGEVAGLPGDSNEGMAIDHAGKKLYVNLTARMRLE